MTSAIPSKLLSLSQVKSTLLLVPAVLVLCGSLLKAQDNVKGGAEPIVSSIDPAELTYDYLVDANLPQDDPAGRKFKTLQAAYAAAPAGTEAKPTVIGIKPGVYPLPGGARGPSLSITKNYITLLGLTNNRRAVVLADNRGLMQGAEDDGYIVDVNVVESPRKVPVSHLIFVLLTDALPGSVQQGPPSKGYGQ